MASDTRSEPREAATEPVAMSFEEFLASWGEDWAEWVDGKVIRMMPVSDEHQHTARFLLTLIGHFAEERAQGVVLYEPFVMKTGADLPGRSPDVLWVSEEHKGRLRQNYLEGPADLVVEIISPDSRARDRREKFREYEQGGVPEYWLVDPQRRQVEFYVLGPDRIFRPAPIVDGVFRSTVLSGLWIKVDWLWQRPLPRVLDVLKEWGLV